jgi:hypothetical protein
MAERTGLEPATPGVTGRYSNQLNYRSLHKLETRNRKPGKSADTRQRFVSLQFRVSSFQSPGLVGAEGFEPPTFAL